MEVVDCVIAIMAIALCLVVVCLRVVCLSCNASKLQDTVDQLQDTVDKLSKYPPHEDTMRQSIAKGACKQMRKVRQGHEMTQANKDARAKMYKWLRERPNENVEEASDKMSMRLQEAVPRELEVTGVDFVQVRPGPAINILFDRKEGMPALCRLETDDGFPIGNGEWSERDTKWVLRITGLPVPPVSETKPINIVLEGPPGPESSFVEIETDDGKSIRLGNWAPRLNGLWSLRITELPAVEPEKLFDMGYVPHLSDVPKKDDK